MSSADPTVYPTNNPTELTNTIPGSTIYATTAPTILMTTSDALTGQPSNQTPWTTFFPSNPSVVPTHSPTTLDDRNSDDTNDGGSTNVSSDIVTTVIYAGVGVIILGIIISIACFVFVSKRKSVKQNATTMNNQVNSTSMQPIKKNENDIKHNDVIDTLEIEFNAQKQNNLNVDNEMRMTVEGEPDEYSQEGDVDHGEHAHVSALKDEDNTTQLNEKENEHDSDTEASIKYTHDQPTDQKHSVGDQLDTR